MQHDENKLLTNFNNAPDCAWVKIDTLQALLGGYSKSTIWRLVKAQKIPKPTKICGTSNVWQVGELRSTLAKMGGNE